MFISNFSHSSGRKRLIGFRASMEQHKSGMDRLADWLTSSFGTVTFLIGNSLFFLLWIIINTYEFGWSSFDPFPFGLLTMVVSLEAIALSIIVLISQNRENFITDLRDEVDFQINWRAEEEITRILKMLDEIHDHLGMNPKDDRELKSMKQRMDISRLRDELVKEMHSKKN